MKLPFAHCVIAWQALGFPDLALVTLPAQTYLNAYSATSRRAVSCATVIPIRQLPVKYQKLMAALRRPSVSKPLRGVLLGVALGVAALVVLISVRIAIDYAKEFQFESAAKREAQLAAADGRTEREIHEALAQKAQALGLPVNDQSIEVHVIPPSDGDIQTGHLLSVLGVQSRTTTKGHVDIAIRYDIPYRFPGIAAAVHFHFAVNDGSI